MAKTPPTKPSNTPALDPMPGRIEPCEPKLVNTPPKGQDWAYEVKWDGYRIALHIEPGRVRILTHNGHDWTTKFPAIATEATHLSVKTAILDGEAVILDDQGRSDFVALKRALGRLPGAHAPDEILLMAFDVLYLDGRDLRLQPQRERRRQLEQLVAGRVGAIRLSEEFVGDGAALLRAACAKELEGVVAKRRDKPYRSGRRPEWQKIKCAKRDWFVIVGFRPSRVPGRIRSLMVAAREGPALVYVGDVGSGFGDEMSKGLRELLEMIVPTSPAVTLAERGGICTEPRFVAEIQYHSWTEDRKLRHASFKGVREWTNDAIVYSLP